MLYSENEVLAALEGDGLEQISGQPPEPGPVKTLAQLERHHILEVLTLTGGNQMRAAALLGLKRGTFRGRLKKLAIRLPEELSKSPSPAPPR